MKKIGVIFGGMSTEHDISIVSGMAVIKNLKKDKYEIFPIYIDKEGNWYKYIFEDREINFGELIKKGEIIENKTEYIKQMDVIFPVLHGLYGEDGTIQGLLELLKIPYVGSKVLGSAIGMDKVYTKIIFEKAKIPQVKYLYIRKYNENYIYVENDFEETILDINDLCIKINENLKFPMFVKPSNSGSSVGINKVENINKLEEAIKFAAKFDNKILIEEGIEAREIECAVLGNEDVETSVLGEILPAEDFYSFDAKYKNKESKLVIPANIDKDVNEKIRKLAKKAYKAIDAKGISRIDFFLDKRDNEIYINEINTMPGFTTISMYPKLWEKTGISYSDLLDKLIKLALEV